MRFAHLIWGNFRRHKVRTLLTLLSIIVAFILFGFLAAVKQALMGGVTLEGVNRLVVRHRVSIIQTLPESYQQRMLKIPGVAAATHLTWFGGQYQDPKNFFPQMPVKPEEFLDLHPEYRVAADQKAAWLATRTGAIVGRMTAKKFGWKIGDKVPLTSPIWPREGGNQLWEFDIVGIFDGASKNTDTTQMFFRHDYFEEGRAMGKGEVGWYMIRVSDPKRAPEIARQIDETFQNSRAETKTETEGAFIQSFARQVGDIVLITGAILGAVFFTILLVAGNTMSQAVRERTGEIGVLKALGFTHGQVMMMVLTESCLLAVLGGAVGLGTAVLLISGGDPTGGMLPLFHFPLRDVLYGAGLSLGLGLATGVFPAWQAMRLRVADSLRRI